MGQLKEKVEQQEEWAASAGPHSKRRCLNEATLDITDIQAELSKWEKDPFHVDIQPNRKGSEIDEMLMMKLFQQLQFQVQQWQNCTREVRAIM